jgi:hypothetical protein
MRQPPALTAYRPGGLELIPALARAFGHTLATLIAYQRHLLLCRACHVCPSAPRQAVKLPLGEG